MHDFGTVILAIVGGVLSVTLASVVLAQRAQTTGVIQAGASGLASVIGAAVAPISGTNQVGG